MVTTRKRVAKKSAPSRASHLEERLHNLLILLRDSQPLGGGGGGGAAAAAAAAAAPSSSSSSHPAAASSSSAAGSAVVAAAAAAASSSLLLPPPPSSPSSSTPANNAPAGGSGASVGSVRDWSWSPLLERTAPWRGANAGPGADRPPLAPLGPSHSASSSLLESSSSSSFGPPNGGGASASAAAAAAASSSSLRNAEQPSLFPGPATPLHRPPVSRSTAASEAADPDNLDGVQLPTPIEAEACIDRFRLWLEEFPFMRLDPDVSSEGLRRERPVLWLSVLNLCTRSLRLQGLLRDRVRNEFSRRILVGCERSLDLIQACIAHLAWAMFNAGSEGRPILGMMVQIIWGMASEMGLTEHPSEEVFTTIIHQVWSKRSAFAPRTRTMDERRAVLSSWFLASVYATFLSRSDALTFTSAMQDSLDILARDRDHPHDQILVALVRLQLIGEDAHRTATRNSLSSPGVPGESPAPVLELKRRLLSNLESVRAASPTRYGVHSHSLAVEAKILSIGVFGERLLPDAPRAESTYALLLAVKAWYEAFLSSPPTVLCTLALHQFGAITYMQHLLYVMTLGDDVAGARPAPGWDRAAVRSVADLLAYTDRCIDIFEQMDRAHAFRRDVDELGFFLDFARVTRLIRSVWEPLLRRGAPAGDGAGNDMPRSPLQQNQDQQQQQVEMMPAMDNMLGLWGMDSMNWMSSFMEK
ncbi:hypothetical protein ESCO_001247 [Escovopsis weberi]|uniref:Uncharacterized protein n=1 Tax=Escovopsis weberi TaxID=150374 RepID=A0A0M8N2Z4_ESCWE|nr:hypothetical protein ESCO_001247 [Escovopsis weberi]